MPRVSDNLRLKVSMLSASSWQWSSKPLITCRALIGNVASVSTSSMSPLSLPIPFGTVRVNSVARLRMAFASIVCCLTSDRALCNASTPCCSKLFADEKNDAADAAAPCTAASRPDVKFPFFTNGRTASGTISFTLCPSPVSIWAQWCAAPQAS